MSGQPTLQTESDLLENPQEPPKQKGLVPRSSVFYALGFFIVLLIGFAIHDLSSSPSAANGAVGTAQTGNSSGQVKVDPLGPAPQSGDISKLRDDQEKKVPDPKVEAKPEVNAPRAPATVATQISGPTTVGEVAPNVLKRPTDGRTAGQGATNGAGSDGDMRTERDAAASESQLFAFQSANTDQISAAAAALGGGSDPIQRQIDSLRRLSGASSGVADPAAEVTKVLAAMQGNQKPQAAQTRDQAWLTGESATTTAEATYAKTPASPFMIFEGTRVPVVTREEINSDLPGQITAMSTVNVYDSINQCAVLIPAGTKFIGRYSADIRPGQSRLLLAYRRMIFPDGRSVDLEGAQGVDGRGAAGAEGDVNNHFMQMFGYGFALAIIGDRLGSGNTNVTTRNADGTSQTTTVAGQVISDTANKILSRNSTIPPTIKLEPGSRMFVTVIRDIALTPTTRKNCSK